MSRIKIIAISIAAIFSILFFLGYFDKPETKVHEFTEALNNLDIEAALDTIDNPEVNALKRSINLIGNLSGKFLNVNATELLYDFLPVMGFFMDTDELPQMTFKVAKVTNNFSRSEATVYGTLYLKTNDNIEEANAIFYLKKKDRNWYITDIQDGH